MDHYNSKKRRISKTEHEFHSSKKSKFSNTEQEFYSRMKRKISKVYEEDQDHISDLPEDILLHILSFMHIKLAARTSVLSMRWRYLWTWHSSLDFSYWKPAQIDQCLHLHRAPKLRSFKIEKSVHNYSPKKVIASHRWVRFAVMRKVEELSLVLPRELFPFSLLDCQTLSHLILKQGLYYFNGEFGGFKSLVTLYLEDVRIDNDVLNILISKCDLLENLKVAECRFGNMFRPKICANHSSQLRNLEIIFEGSGLEGLEVVAPGILFISSTGELRVLPRSYPRLSWEADAEGWRCMESAISCVKEKNLLVGDWLFRLQLGVSSILNMRCNGVTFFCKFHICSNK